MKSPAATLSLAALPETLRPLAQRGELRSYGKGLLLIQEGDLGDTLFIIVSGSVKAFSTDSRDHEIIYGVYGAGLYFGEMSLDGGPRSASVITLEHTSCVVVTRQTLRLHIAEFPEFAFELLARVIHRARAATQSARNMALLDVYGRLVPLLESLSEPLPDGTRIVKRRLTHREIAAHIGSSREMVTRQMADLMAGKYIAIEDGLIHIHHPLPPRW